MRVGGRAPPLAPDPELIRRLAELLTETGLTEIEYAVGGHRLRVARNMPGAAVPVTAAPPPMAAQVMPPPAAAPAPLPGAELAAHPGAVKSPMVGVAYLAPQPGAPRFVQPGDAVEEGQTLLIIEAMKVMNQIRSPRAGRLARIVVEDAEPVEYGSVLMVIE